MGPHADNAEHPLCAPGEICTKQGEGMKKVVPSGDGKRGKEKIGVVKECGRHNKVASLSAYYAILEPKWVSQKKM